MARLLVNKHFTEHNEAINGFTNVEDYAFGEIIICNDSEKPSIYIKDVDNNSVAISNIKVSETDNILSLEDNKLSAKISMVWDPENDKIKLLGKAKNDTDVVLSEIEIFNDEENGIGNKIDNAVERVVDVTLFSATDTELPEGTEIGQDYLKIETSSNGVVKQSYIPFLTVDKLFTVEGEDNTDKSGKIIVTKDEENNKYVISHGEVNRVGEKLENPTFGLTPFISEIGVNDLGHVTSVKTSVLPLTPGISVTTAPEELPEDDANLYVSKVTKTDKMGLTVTYSELPKVDIDATVENSTNKTLTFISNIGASGSTITGVTSEVDLDAYAKTDDFYSKKEIDDKFKNIIDPDGELIVPPVVITGDTTEVGKYIYDINVNSEGALEIKTETLGLDSYVNKDDVSASDTTLEWGINNEIIKIGEKTTTVTLPIKPGIEILKEEDTSSKSVIVGVESVKENTDKEVLSMKFKTKEFDFEEVLIKKEVGVPSETPTLAWEEAVTIATIGGTNINVAMPNPVNVKVTGENVNEINNVVTAIESDEHGIKVKNAPFSTKNYVANDEVKTSNVELPWGTKDAEGNVNTTTIATIGEKKIKVALPEKPVVGMVTGNTVTENPVVVTNIELNENNELVVNFQDALPKNYITSEDLKTYLDVDSIKVVDGTDNSTENKFITSIVTGKTEDNDVQLTVNYGQYNIDSDTTISSEAVQLEWDISNDIAKIGNKTISVKLPKKDDVNAIVAEKIVTYDLDKTQEDNKITISLTPTINNEKGEADTIDIDLSNYVNENVDITIDNNPLPENYTGNTFIKNISINGTEITREFGNVNVDVSSDGEVELRLGEAVEIAKVDGKSIFAKLPSNIGNGEGADGNTLYKLLGTLTGDEFKVSLMSSTNGNTYETPAGSATLDLSSYLTSGNVVTYIPVKDVKVNDVSVLDENGIAKINSSKYTISGSSENGEYKITLNNFNDESESSSVTFTLKDENTTIGGHYDPLESLTTTTLSAEPGQYISAISFDKKKHITGITATELPKVEKLDVGTVGSITEPVYFKDGVPEKCNLTQYLTNEDISQANLITILDDTYLTGETYKGTVTDVKTVVSNTDTSTANTATENSATYLNTVLTNSGEPSVVSSHNIIGSGSVSVSSDKNGVITISGAVYQPIGNYLTKEEYLGTISGITVGSGLTGGGSATTGATGITIKPNLNSYSFLNGQFGDEDRLYAVGINGDNELCVKVPWVGTVTSVKVKTGSEYLVLTGSTITSSGSYTFDLSEDTKTKIDNGNTAYGWGNHASKGYWLPITATTASTGIVMLVTGDMNGKAHADGQAPSLSHSHSQYVTFTELTNKNYATQTWVKNQGYLTDEYNLPIATATVLGGIKLGYSGSGKNYPVQTTNDGTAYVYVPWSDTNTDTATTQEGHYSPRTVEETVTVGDQTPSHGGTFNIPTISFDNKGHYVTTGTTTVTLPTDTHYTSKNIVSSASTATTDTAAILNGKVYLNHIENGVVTSSHLLEGSHGIVITRPSSDGSIDVDISHIIAGTGITNTSTGYTQGKAVYEYVNTTVPDIVDNKLSGFTGSDEKVKSEVIGDTTKAYLLASSASDVETGTTLKSTSIFMSGNTLTAAAFYQVSDERLKDFHNDIEVDFDKLREMPKSYFTWKSDDTKTMQLGTSAQKVKELYPELVGGTEESLSVDYARLSIVALKAVDKLHEENEKLRAELDIIKKHLGL